MNLLQTWFASGRIFDAVLALLACEVLAVAALCRAGRLAVSPWQILPTVLSGAGIVLAARLMTLSAPWPLVAASLLCGGLAHLADLRRQARAASGASVKKN